MTNQHDLKKSEEIGNNYRKFKDISIFVILFLFLIWLIVLSVYVTKQTKETTTLYLNNGKNNKIKSTTVSKVLYEYNTRNTNSLFKSYTGEFLVTYYPIGSVNFKVTNIYGEDITGPISNSQYPYVPSRIEFNSTNPTGAIILNYSSSIDFDLERLEISI